MEHQNKIFALEGKVQHYQWGGFTFLPELLSRENSGDMPYAEYWLGAHAQAPSEIVGNGGLDEFISNDLSLLGEKVKDQFGKLPYLLKVLDVKDMLSIQVHPSKERAIKGFAAENAAGVPPTAASRNYKDDNHKPELMVALGEFWLLHGFRPIESMIKVLAIVPELEFLVAEFGEGNYERLYRRVMEMDSVVVKQHLQPLLNRVIPQYQAGELSKSDPSFWAARAALTFNKADEIDRGIFSIFLLNLVHVKKGEALFQDAGILHAYLEGQNVEIMANSDNVLRGGLTPKHIDVPELMKHVIFEAIEPNILKGVKLNENELVFKTPAVDFELSKIVIEAGADYSFNTDTVDILLVMEGAVNASENAAQGTGTLKLERGQSAVLVDGAEIDLASEKGAVLYRATVPQ